MRFALALLVPAIVCAQTTSYEKQRTEERAVEKRRAVEERKAYAASITETAEAGGNQYPRVYALGPQATHLFIWSLEGWTKGGVDIYVRVCYADWQKLGFTEITFEHPASAKDDPATVHKTKGGINLCIFASFTVKAKR